MKTFFVAGVAIIKMSDGFYHWETRDGTRWKWYKGELYNATAAAALQGKPEWSAVDVPQVLLIDHIVPWSIGFVEAVIAMAEKEG